MSKLKQKRYYHIGVKRVPAPLPETSAAVNMLFRKSQRDLGDDFLAVRLRSVSEVWFDEVINLLGRGLCGTSTTAPDPVLDWCYCARVRRFYEPVRHAPSAARSNWFRWFGGFCVHFGLARGGVYALVDKINGSVVAAAVLGPPGSAPMAEMSAEEYEKLLREVGTPPPNDSDGVDVMARVEALDASMANAHERLASDGRHLYVLMIATEPRLQGRRRGTVLLRLIEEIADADGAATYLEAVGRRNEEFFRQAGFEVGARSSVRACDGRYVFEQAGPRKRRQRHRRRNEHGPQEPHGHVEKAESLHLHDYRPWPQQAQAPLRVRAPAWASTCSCPNAPPGRSRHGARSAATTASTTATCFNN